MTTTTGQVTFTAPSVSTNIAYPITATALGYYDATTTITVLNVPKLIVVVTDTNIKTGQTFHVAVADDQGNPVIGATVTITGTTTSATTGTQGAALTAPSQAGNYTVTATFSAYTPATSDPFKVTAAGIPGFELLTLIVAVGIAFLLIRRRRN